MNINIIGQKIEPESQYLRKGKSEPKEEIKRFALFIIGIIVGAVITFIVSNGGTH